MTSTRMHGYEQQARHLAITSLGIGVAAAVAMVGLGLVSFGDAFDPAEWIRIAISVLATLGGLVAAALAVFAWSQGEPHGEARRWAGAELVLAAVWLAVFVVMLNVGY